MLKYSLLVLLQEINVATLMEYVKNSSVVQYCMCCSVLCFLYLSVKF